MQAKAESHKSFGPELRRRRTELKLSLSELERIVFFSKGHLSKVETGAKRPSVDLARRCDEALNAGGALQALVRREPRHLAIHEPGPRPMTEWSWPVRPWLEGLGLPLNPQVDPLEGWHSLYRDLRNIGQTTAPVAVIPLAISATESLRAMSIELRSPARERALILASRFGLYAGWMMQEAGNDEGAMAATMRAVELAEAAGDAELAAYALVRKGLVALYGDDAELTVQLGRRAQILSHDPRVLGLAAQREAQGHALAGDGLASMRAIDRARAHFAAVQSDDDMLVGTSTLTDPAEMVAGWCLYDIGRPAKAAEVIATELARVPVSAQRSRCRWGARLALSQAGVRDIEEACETIEPVLRVAATIDSATIRKDLRKLNAALTRWDSHPRVRRISAALTAVSTAQR